MGVVSACYSSVSFPSCSLRNAAVFRAAFRNGGDSHVIELRKRAGEDAFLAVHEYRCSCTGEHTDRSASWRSWAQIVERARIVGASFAAGVGFVDDGERNDWAWPMRPLWRWVRDNAATPPTDDAELFMAPWTNGEPLWQLEDDLQTQRTRSISR